MSRLKEQAEALAKCLNLQLADVPDVVAWADGWMSSLTTPHWSLCELAVASRKSVDEIVVLLRAIPGDASPRQIVALECVWLRALRDDSCLDDVWLARQLGEMGIHKVEGLVDVGLRCGMFYDYLQLADAGLLQDSRYRSRKDVAADMNATFQTLCSDARWVVDESS
jgi:hypothetical protein